MGNEDGDELSEIRQQFTELSEEHESLKTPAKRKDYAAHESHRTKLVALIDRLHRFRDKLNRP